MDEDKFAISFMSNLHKCKSNILHPTLNALICLIKEKISNLCLRRNNENGKMLFAAEYFYGAKRLIKVRFSSDIFAFIDELQLNHSFTIFKRLRERFQRVHAL